MTDTLDALERIADDLNRHAAAHPAYKDSSGVARNGARAILSLIARLRAAEAEQSYQDMRAREISAVDLPPEAQWLLRSKDQWQARAKKAEERVERMEGLLSEASGYLDDFWASEPESDIKARIDAALSEKIE